MDQERRIKFTEVIKADTSLTRLIKALGKQLEILIETGKTDVNAFLSAIFEEAVLTKEEYTEIAAGLSEVSRLHCYQCISHLYK
jgi:hypothetical protein